MTKRRSAAALAALAAGLTLAGCLFRKAEAPRFYRPASAALDDAAESPPAPSSGSVPVRLGNVRSAPFLRERIVWRASPVEYGLYEQRRWFELPSRYVRRALLATLESTNGLVLSQDGKSPRLDVEVLAFDEVLSPSHEAHVVLAATVREGSETRLDRTFAASSPITGDDGAAMAESMGHALDEAVKKVATAAASALATKPTSPTRPRSK